ncbi:MAG: cell division protein [Alphaproteobacteria bacterium]|nr:cell division protein [Alphaproteobacteria bacterium]
MIRRTDIPFERDQSTRFLPWIVALMVFLGTLMFAVALLVSDAVETWDTTLTGRITIQVPLREAAPEKVEALVEILRSTDGIAAVRALPPDESRALLVPWLGEGVVGSGLPVPLLIDVEVAPGSRIDPVVLEARLVETIEGIAVDDHRAWLSALINLARTAELLALAILALIAASAVIAVVFTTRSGLAVHSAIIELLHQMGARDAYIAGQFQIQAMLLAARGGLGGAAAAGVVLLIFAWIGRGVESAFLPRLNLSVGDWLLLLVVPASAIAISMLTARMTVLRALARMP